MATFHQSYAMIGSFIPLKSVHAFKGGELIRSVRLRVVEFFSSIVYVLFSKTRRISYLKTSHVPPSTFHLKRLSESLAVRESRNLLPRDILSGVRAVPRTRHGAGLAHGWLISTATSSNQPVAAPQRSRRARLESPQVKVYKEENMTSAEKSLERNVCAGLYQALLGIYRASAFATEYHPTS